MGTRLAPAKKGSEHLVPGPISSLTPYARRQSLITGIIHCNTSLFVKKKRKEKKKTLFVAQTVQALPMPVVTKFSPKSTF